MSPMNPNKRTSNGLMSGVNIGGALGSMNTSGMGMGMGVSSPPSSGLAARRRLMGGSAGGSGAGAGAKKSIG